MQAEQPNMVKITEIVTTEQLDALDLLLKDHIENEDKTPFSKVIEDEFISRYEGGLTQKFKMWGIDLTMKTFAFDLQFTTCTYYFGRRSVENTEFTRNEKVWLASLSMFEQDFGQEDYPFTTIEEQFKELKEQVSEAYVNTVAEWTIDHYKKMYLEQFVNGPTTLTV